MNLFCISKDASGRTSKQEEVEKLVIYRGDGIVLCRREEACDLIEGED